MKTKFITIFFSSLLAASFLFMGFNRFISPDYILKIDSEAVTVEEFNQLFSNYKSNLGLQQLSPQEEIVSKINYINQLINDRSLKKYLSEKIQLNEESIMVILKKSLAENENINEISSTQLQEVLGSLKDDISKEIFIKNLEVNIFRDIDIDERLLKEKSIKVFKIKDRNLDVNSAAISKYQNSITNYKINIQKIDLVKYLEETIINEEIINNYYNENINDFTLAENYSYDQIIIKEKDLTSNQLADYKNEINLFSSFTNVEESRIIPKILEVLKDLKKDQDSDIFNVGDLNYILKLKEKNEQKTYSVSEKSNEIRERIIQNEINNINNINLNEVNIRYIDEEIYFTDNFLFKENLMKDNYPIFENQEKGNFKDKSYYYDYTITETSSDNIPLTERDVFINKFLNFNFKKETNIDQFAPDELLELNTIQTNYFSRSINLEDQILAEDQLKKVILMKKKQPTKIILNNDVYILEYTDDGSTDPESIKNTVVNIFYNELLNAIKSLYEIEINNEKILQ